MTTTVVFTDADGVTGYVTDGLEVDYHGRWADEVRESIESVADEHHQDNDEIHVDEVGTDLLIELPEGAPIVEVERVDEAASPAE